MLPTGLKQDEINEYFQCQLDFIHSFLSGKVEMYNLFMDVCIKDNIDRTTLTQEVKDKLSIHIISIKDKHKKA